MEGAVVAEVADKLGVGIYTVSEAARYVRARPQTLSRWFFQTPQSRPVVRSEHSDDEKLLSFRNLVECLAIRAARNAGVSMQKIRQTLNFVRATYGIDHPLAHKYPLHAVGDRLVIEIDGELIETTQPFRGQRQLRKIVQPFLQELKFDEQSGEAVRWVPEARSGTRKSEPIAIVLDPTTRFGQPFLSPFGVSVQVLVDAIAGEGSVEAAAEAYEVPVEAAYLAAKYLDSLLYP